MAKCTAEPKVSKERQCATDKYIERMRKHLVAEKDQGLVDIRFCAVPAKGASTLTAEGLARAYCEVFGC